MANFYISDLHIGHQNVLKMDNRPFQTLEEMNEKLIENWNSIVTGQDTTYIIGDFLWTYTKESYDVIRALNGNKILLHGNHDKCHNTEFKRLFGGIDDLKTVKDGDKSVVLCHYPIMFYNGHRYNGIHLYGHTHMTKEYYDTVKMKQQLNADGYNLKLFNVGCMLPYMDYTPRTLEYIIEQAELYEKGLMLQCGD